MGFVGGEGRWIPTSPRPFLVQGDTHRAGGLFLVAGYSPLSLDIHPSHVIESPNSTAFEIVSIPANATEAPSIVKVWQQTKANAPTFAAIWGLILITTLIDTVFSGSLHFVSLHLLEENIGAYSDLQADAIASFISTVGSLPTTILVNLASILMMAVAAIYYTTDRCPHPGEIVGILSHKPLRYLLAGFQFVIVGAIGFLLCVIPGILVFLASPLYVHYVFTTNLNLITCLSKALKGMFQNSGFGSFLGVSLLCGLAVSVATLACIFPVLAVLPMTALYMQNYIHHKGLVRARELA